MTFMNSNIMIFCVMSYFYRLESELFNISDLCFMKNDYFFYFYQTLLLFN